MLNPLLTRHYTTQVKVLNRKLAVVEEKHVKAFFLEAKLLANLRHPHIVSFQWGYMSGPFLLAMELCKNGSLGDRIGGKIIKNNCVVSRLGD